VVTVIQIRTAFVDVGTVDAVCIKLKSLIATALLNTAISKTDMLTLLDGTLVFRYAGDVVRIQPKSIDTATAEGTWHIVTHLVTWNTGALVHVGTVAVILQLISCEAFTAEERYLIGT
jgi:hypothetical protein